MQATKFLAPQNIAPTLKIGNLGQPKYMPLIQQGNGAQTNVNLPVVQKPVEGNLGKIVTLPAPTNTAANNNSIGKIVTLPVTNTNTGAAGKVVSMPVTIGKAGTTVGAKPANVPTQNNPIHINNGVGLNNNPVNKVQVQNTRPQLNATNRIVSGGNNVRQSMNQSNMNGGNNHRGFMH
ncbi:hypothetical protein ACVWYK_002362 [Bradyrhizobium sp. USDA 4470]